VAAILPLVPDFSWLIRLFPLSPLLLAPALPFCLSSTAAKKPGALAFSGAVVMPVLGSLLCLAALKYPDLHPAAAQGGLWGLAAGGLGLALARVPRNVSGPGPGDEDNEGPAMPDTPGGLSTAFSVLSPQSQYEELPPMAVTHIGGAGDAEPAGTPGNSAGPEDGQRGGDSSAEGKAGLPRTPGERSEPAQNISFFLPSAEDRSYLDLPAEVMNILEGPAPADNMRSGSYPFNLHTLVRQVHDIVSPLAESKGLIFSWYMSPSLPILLEGDSPRLRGALILLLQSAVQAADGGAVQLAVRRNPMTSFEGDLLFSISDNGSSQRTDAGFFLAWELASRTGGAFTVDYSAAGGTRTAFSARFKLLGAETAIDPVASALPPPSGAEGAVPTPPRIGGTRSPCILLAEMTGGARRHIARCLEGVPHTAVNAFDEEQLLRLAGEHEPALVIFDADMPENVIARCIADLRVDEGAKGRKGAAVLVLTGHDLQAARLLEAGAGYVLGKPFTREAFLDVLAAVDRSGIFAQPVPDLATPFRGTLPKTAPSAGSAPASASGTLPASGSAPASAAGSVPASGSAPASASGT
jgi:CheY-like chemotaxis protein